MSARARSTQHRPRIAVVGGGMCGLAVAYHLLRQNRRDMKNKISLSPISVTVFDPAEPGKPSGASAVAAGLLHPLSPRGTYCWRGKEGLNATLALCAAAQEALHPSGNTGSLDRERANSGETLSNVVVSDRILRPALKGPLKNRFTPGDDAQASRVFAPSGKKGGNAESVGAQRSGESGGAPPMTATTTTTWVDSRQLQRELLGVAVPNCAGAAAINGGCVVDTRQYMYGLWLACQGLGDITWERSAVDSVLPLLASSSSPFSSPGAPRGAPAPESGDADASCEDRSGFDAVVVCAGAGIRFLPETLQALCADDDDSGGGGGSSSSRDTDRGKKGKDGDAGAPGGRRKKAAPKQTAAVKFSRGESVELHRLTPIAHEARITTPRSASAAKKPSSSPQRQPPPGLLVLPSALLCGEYVVPVGEDRIVLGATHEHVSVSEDLTAIADALPRRRQREEGEEEKAARGLAPSYSLGELREHASWGRLEAPPQRPQTLLFGGGVDDDDNDDDDDHLNHLVQRSEDALAAPRRKAEAEAASGLGGKLGASAAALWPPFLEHARAALNANNPGKKASPPLPSPQDDSDLSSPASPAAAGSAAFTTLPEFDVHVTHGVRVIPQKRSHLGKLPIAGRLKLTRADTTTTTTVAAAAAAAAAPAAAVAVTRAAPNGVRAPPSAVGGREAHEEPFTQREALAMGAAAAEVGKGRREEEEGEEEEEEGRVWVLTALGSRGLIHHAYLAEALAKAVLSGDESHLPQEVRPETRGARRIS